MDPKHPDDYVQPADKTERGNLDSRFSVLIEEAEKLGDTELIHAVDLNRIQFLYSGDERRRMLENILEKDEKEGDISDWTRSLCEYLLAYNADSRQGIGFRASALFKMQKLG